MTLPPISANVIPVPVVGDMAKQSFERADGTQGKLTDFHGRYTVVHFWASWCTVCKQQMPELRRLHERYATHGLATVGLSLDEDRSAWEASLKRLDLPWQQGRLSSAASAGISSVPAYWLVGPDNKIVAKVTDLNELANILAERLK
jgi:thiol-disulfide isomerase/thioredoxin